jgi:ribosomal protein S18 acetylase RimI-like enzyme
MTLTQYPFSGAADIPSMLALAHAFPSEHLRVIDLPYRLSSWALDDPANAALWRDSGDQLIAWAVLQTPFWTIDYVIHPVAEQALHRQVLDWAERRAEAIAGTPAGLPAWNVMAFADQAGRILDLIAAGFANQADAGEDSWSKVFLRRPASRPLTTGNHPPGFSLRPLAGESEVAAYVDLHRAVFQSKNMTAGWRGRTLHAPGYRPDLDMVAVTPDGHLAGFCIGWLGRRDGVVAGQIEPFGVGREHRSLGLAWALLAETVRCLYQSGAEYVYVETDNYRDAALGIYQAIGFEVVRDVLVFRKDFAGII